MCSQMHGQQVLQTESIASGLVISLVSGLSRRRIQYPSVLNFPVRGGVVELILVGVVRHVGETPKAGHYFAVIQNFEDSSSWICDDSVVSKTTETVLLGELKGHPVLMFYIRKEVLEAVRKRKRDSIALDAKRSSDCLRQRARRAANSKEAAKKARAANTVRDRERRAALPQGDRKNDRAANTALATKCVCPSKKKTCIDRLFSKNGRMPGGAGRRTSTSFEAINASSATGIPNLVR